MLGSLCASRIEHLEISMCRFVCMEFVYTCGCQPFSQPVVATNSEECIAHQQVMQKCSRPYWEHDEPFFLCLSVWRRLYESTFLGVILEHESLSPPGVAYAKMGL